MDMAQNDESPNNGPQNSYQQLAAFVEDQCSRRLRAYSAQPRDANEHYETEVEVLSGGYAYRQLFELVQNAADAILESGAGRGRIHILLKRDRLIAANTGAPLDEDGIVALLNARSSAKRAGQIGRFGVGFKSLLKLGGRVDLVSRTIGLRFDPAWCRATIRSHLGLTDESRAPGMRLAQVIDPNATDSPLWKYGEYDWATTVVLAEIANNESFERLEAEIAAFPAEFVLFLDADVDLDLEVEGGSTRSISKRKEGAEVVTTDGTNEARWRLFSQKVQISDPEARDDATHIQAREDVPLSWAVPIGPRETAGYFWAFFPTQTPTSAAGILNAPWKLNSDRTNLIQGPWNEHLMAHAANLIADNIGSLSTAGDPGAPISALPRKLERQDDIAASLINPLWKLLVSREIVPDANGELHSPGTLRRHAIEQVDSIVRWAALASVETLAEFAHSSCYSGANRLSRFSALAREAKDQAGAAGGTPLEQVSLVTWLEAVASLVPSRAAALLEFVSELFDAKLLGWNHSVTSAQIIPTHDQKLAAANQVILAPPERLPAGFHAVLQGLADQPAARAILMNRLDVKVMDDEAWEEILQTLFFRACAYEMAEHWENFWSNFSQAPSQYTAQLLESIDASDLKFRNLAGGWSERDEVLFLKIVDASVSVNLQIDWQFHEPHIAKLPEEMTGIFPDDELEDYAAGGLNAEKIVPYFNLVRRVGWAKIEHGPQQSKLDISLYNLKMPRGWRLLPSLPPKWAAELSSRLIKAMYRQVVTAESRWPNYVLDLKPILYMHTTRPDTWSKLSAPHPLIFWLSRYGVVSLDSTHLPVRTIDSVVASALADAKLAEFAWLQELHEARAAPTDLGGRIKWDSEALTPAEEALFWQSVFAHLKRSEADFRALEPVWELAASRDAIPDRVPTAQGPMPLSQIFVAEREAQRANLVDDGLVVLLTANAGASWRAAGAQALDASVRTEFDEQVCMPLPVVEAFPDLGVLLEGQEAAKRDMVLVTSLTAHAANSVTHPIVAVSDDGLLLVSSELTSSLGWQERSKQLMQAFHLLGLLDATPEELLARLADSKVVEARAHVKAGSNLADRLARAVGGSTDALLDILAVPVRDAITKDLSLLESAELALAVYGPTILSKISDIMAVQGLSPPARWGTEDAHRFAAETGFPIEFASSAKVRRDAELVISGPLDLPRLHDYQEDILASVGELFESSDGRRRAVISLPTGGGKTRVAAEAVVRLILNGEHDRTVLWVAQTDELCEQAVQCFRQLWVNVGSPGEDLRIIRLWGGQGNPTPPETGEPVVVVASIQTLNSRIDLAHLTWLAKPGVLVIDECHHAIAPSYSKLLRWLDVQTGGEAQREAEPLVLGLSATPWRGKDSVESARLSARFDRRWFPADQAKLHQMLRDRGVLAELAYAPINYEKPISLSDIQARHFKQYGELPDDIIEEIGADPDRNERIIDAVLKSEASSILLFANSVAHAQHLAARLHLAGCSAAAVSGETDRLARQHFIRRFRSGELRVMCNHSVLTTGFDAPKADMIVISRPVFSAVRYMQMVGRGLRGPANGGTESCRIVTVEDNILTYRDRLAYHYCRHYFTNLGRHIA